MSAPLWTTDDLAAAMAARRFGNLPAGVTGISIDTRTVQPGEAFFAVKGERFDGHHFVTQAMKAGASLAVVAEEKLVAMGRTTLPFLVVDDVAEALRRLARAARARSAARIVAVTGSVGKTTTKDMLRVALAACGSVHAATASFNNHWGVPLTLARMPREARFGVFEIGMNHAGEIEPLVALVRPHVAIITTIAPAHIGAFASIEDIARAKAEIFTGIVDDGVAVLNRDNAHFAFLSQLADAAGVSTIRSFGASAGCDFRLLQAEPRDGGVEVRAAIDGEELSWRIGAPGDHIVANSLAVAGATKLLGAELGPALSALAGFAAGKGRGERHAVATAAGNFTLIDESYNANPASMRAALALLAQAEPGAGGRRIAVLGDMLELGDHSAQMHAGLRPDVEASKADLVFLAGPEMAALATQLEPAVLGGHFANANELGEALANRLRGGDVVMMKASKGIGFAGLVERLLGAGSKDEAR